MRKHAVVGQKKKKDKYLSDKDKAGQQVLDKASTWTNSLNCYDKQLDAPSIPSSEQAHCVAERDYVAVETDLDSSLLMILPKFEHICSKHKWNPSSIEGLEQCRRVFHISCTWHLELKHYHLEYSTHTRLYTCKSTVNL